MISRFLLFLLVLTGAGSALADPAPSEPWLVQLQQADLASIKKEGWKTAVIDYSHDGTDLTAYPPAAIDALKKSGCRVLCYFSIGEAENYRFYWKPQWNTKRPGWMGLTNKDWPGNFKVRYWDPEWRDFVLKPYLEKILAQGFDGVYLDIVDAFEYWGEPETYAAGKEKRQDGDPATVAEAGQRMATLVEWIAATAREKNPAALVVPQNGESILDLDTTGKLLETISGFGIEDLWYDETTRKREAEIAFRLKYLQRVREAGKFIMVIDYVDDPSTGKVANKERIADFRQRCQKESFSWFAAPRNRRLDRTHPIPGVQP